MIPILIPIFAPLLAMSLFMSVAIAGELKDKLVNRVMSALIMIWFACGIWIFSAACQPWRFIEKGQSKITLVKNIAVVSVDGEVLNVNKLSDENFIESESVNVFEYDPNNYYGLSFITERNHKYKIERIK